jgi:hypothetical protein
LENTGFSEQLEFNFKKNLKAFFEMMPYYTTKYSLLSAETLTGAMSLDSCLLTLISALSEDIQGAE